MKGCLSIGGHGSLSLDIKKKKEKNRKKSRSKRGCCSSSISKSISVSSKGKKDEETQRLIHIGLERDRRKQMKSHLDVLRTLMPPSYLHRGDQASIIGGTIEFVKDLESVLKTLQGLYRERSCANDEMRNSYDLGKKVSNTIPSSPIVGTMDFSMMLEPMSRSLFNGMEIPNASTIPVYDTCLDYGGEKKGEMHYMEEGSTWYGDDVTYKTTNVEVQMKRLVVPGHGNCAFVRVVTPWRRNHGELLYATISIIEKQLHFHILHLYINTMDQMLVYSFYLEAWIFGKGMDLYELLFSGKGFTLAYLAISKRNVVIPPLLVGYALYLALANGYGYALAIPLKLSDIDKK